MHNRSRLKWYGLTSSATNFAVDSGLTEGDWFRCVIPRNRIKELMQRSDAPAIRDTVIWIGVALGAATGGILLWGSWWAIPFFLVYGVLYGSASDSRWHESGHGTAFKTRWMDDAVNRIASFCTMRNATVWRWQHTRHHTDTLIVGRDAEIEAMRPARLATILLNFFGLVDVPRALWQMLRQSFGYLSEGEKTFVPLEERHKVYRTSRISLTIYVATIVAALVFHSWLPIVLIGAPRCYGYFMAHLYGLTQHAGLGENVLDYRLNTRTVLMGPVNRFLYWNMNFHIEHHMFPMVPYHQLPDLHEELKNELPTPCSSLWAAYREIVPGVLRQLSDPTYFIKRELPADATPYHGPTNGLFPEHLLV